MREVIKAFEIVEIKQYAPTVTTIFECSWSTNHYRIFDKQGKVPLILVLSDGRCVYVAGVWHDIYDVEVGGWLMRFQCGRLHYRSGEDFAAGLENGIFTHLSHENFSTTLQIVRG
jgi:hypothetical protein